MMRKAQLRGIAVVAVAGLACSAMAQSQEVQGGSRAPKQIKAPNGVLMNHVTLNPIEVKVNGVSVPFTLGSNPSDQNVVVYDNVPAVATAFAAGPAATVGGDCLDDITLSQAGTIRINGIRPSWATEAVVTTAGNVFVDIIWWDSFNAANPQVATNPSVDFAVQFAAPAGGWAANTVYTGGQFFFASPVAVSTTGSGAVEMTLIDATGTLVIPDMQPACENTAVAVGSSSPTQYYGDQNGDGLFQNTELITLAGQNLNMRIAIEADIANAAAAGSCCLGGKCITVTSARCAGLGGVYGGGGTSCATVGTACFTAPVLWDNGPLSTGSVSYGGVTAPAGTTWSEAVREGNCNGNTAGFSANFLNAAGATPIRMADNFVVPAGETWNLTNVTVYEYQTGGSNAVSPFNNINMAIWKGKPGAVGSVIVAGDQTTNVYATSTASFTNIYRIFYSGTTVGNAVTNRPVWQIQVPVTASLTAGTYYVDYSIGATNSGAHFSPPVSPMVVTAAGTGFGVLEFEGSNAVQQIGLTGGWFETGNSPAAAVTGTVNCLASGVEMPFIVRGTRVGGGCYPNCDNSTSPPILNALDFGCFLTKFAAGDTYANCDASTSPPTLNALDFGCFLTKFAAGCT